MNPGASQSASRGTDPVKIGFHLAPQHGAYPAMRKRWLEAEELGVDSLYTSDHFFAQSVDVEAADGVRPPASSGANFEATAIESAMAATTSRPQIGCLVHAIGFRNPNLLADFARTVDHISGGRFILGLGTGYLQNDYEEYGFDWTTQRSRSLELAAKVPIILARLEKLNPPPVSKIPILIATMGAEIGLRVVAAHADIWHLFGRQDQILEKIDDLKHHCKQVGRDFSEIEICTWYTPGMLNINITPDEIIDLGIRNIIHIQTGPDWDLGVLRELLQWRDALK